MPALDWPIHIINLDRADERRAAVTERMRRAGLPFERFSAVDGNALSDADVSAVVAANQVKQFKRPLAKSEVACYLSHIAVWRMIAVSDHPAAFVFEDDVDFGGDGAAVLAAVAGREIDWDILRLYADRPVQLVDDLPLSEGYRYGVSRWQPMTCVAYAITRRAARELAELAVPFGMPIDMDFRHWWRFGACLKQVVPSPFYPGSDHLSSSEIAAGRIDHRSDATFTRFVRNTRYQLKFQLSRFRHMGRIPRQPTWPQDAGRSQP